MKVIGISCSPRKNRTSFTALQKCFDALHEEDATIETEIIELAGLEIKGCTDCTVCKKDLTCSIKDDFVNLIPKLSDKNVKGIIISTPVYMGSITSQGKAFLDRTVMFRRNGYLFKNKIGGVLTVGGSRNGGQELTIQNVHSAMLIHNMLVVSDGPNTSHFGGALWNKGGNGIETDEEGLATTENLGKRIAETLSIFK